jgi:hypothetical protein
MEFKRCSGYGGHWECGDDYPDHMVPVDEFNTVATYKSGLDTRCRRCKVPAHRASNPKANLKHNPKSNAVSAISYKMGGGYKAFYDLPKEDRVSIRATATEEYNSGRTESNPQEPKYDNVIQYVETKLKGRKRDSKVVSYIRSVYDSCSVVGCDYLDYDVAHIHALKHGADDLPENCLALCPNHHRDLDRGRMIDLQQLNGGGYIYFGDEDDRQGIDLKHKVDSKYLDQCNLELEEWKNASNA